jgi:hypothetical protein
MPASDLYAKYKKDLRRMGRWCFVRYARNRGVPFAITYWLVFGRAPRLL